MVLYCICFTNIDSMKASLTVILISLFSLSVFPQTNRANWWYFGNKTGVNFNTTPPTTYANGAMNTLEGSASISDKNGNLLFYTDGRTVYNRNHMTMSNGTGLLGHTSSSHSAVILPYPGDTNLYFIFNVPSQPNIGLNYSIVDMRLSSGLGGVLSTKKNIRLMNPHPVSDKLCAIEKKGKNGYWVVAQRNDNWNLYAFSVTNLGVDTSAVISTTVPVKTGSVPHYGCIKISPNGKKISLAYGVGGAFVIGNFNQSSGQVSNMDTIRSVFPYGIEFSPNSKRLYITNNNGLKQYDLSSNNISLIRRSKRSIANKPPFVRYGQIQTAPNKKLYVARMNNSSSATSFLSVINSPNDTGVSCNFSDSGLVFPAGGRVMLGLPTYPGSYFNEDPLSYANSCVNTGVRFSLYDTTGVDSLFLDFGDSTSGFKNVTRILPDTHMYSSSGIKTLTLILHRTIKGISKTDTFINMIQIDAAPMVNLGNDTSACLGDSLHINILSSIPFSFHWNDSSSLSHLNLKRSGYYWLEASNACGKSRDSIFIKNLFNDSLDLGNDTVICKGNSLRLFTPDTISSYLWNNGDTAFQSSFSSPGKVWLQKTNICGTIKDSIVLTVLTSPKIELGPDTTICSTSPIFIGDVSRSLYSTYLWNTGRTTHRIFVSRVGQYSVIEKNKCGSITDSIFISLDISLVVGLPQDTTVCKGDSMLLKPNSIYPNYFWSTGSVDSSIWISNPGMYTLTSTNACGSRFDSFTLGNYTPVKPVISRVGDTLVSTKSKVYQWHFNGTVLSGDTNQRLPIDTIGRYKVYVTDSNGCQANSVDTLISIIYKDTVGVGFNKLGSSFIDLNYRVYPNPTNDFVIVELRSKEKVDLEVLDAKGAVVIRRSIESKNRLHKERLELHGLTPGSYVVRLSNGQSIRYFRLQKTE